jgi:hypothetical protein
MLDSKRWDSIMKQSGGEQVKQSLLSTVEGWDQKRTFTWKQVHALIRGLDVGKVVE